MRIRANIARVLSKRFFNRPAERVARDLLGKYLVRKIGGKTTVYKIIETEAYVGPHDLACHASKGRTKRTEVMFGPPGVFYVYFCYGVHWMLNVVVLEKEYPAAVLIRGVEGASGPGRVTRKLRITGQLNGKLAAKKSGLWFENRGEKISRRNIKRTPRIGVGHVGPVWSTKKYRFVLS